MEDTNTGDVSQFQVTKTDKHRAGVETELLLLLPYSVGVSPYSTTSMIIRRTDN